MYSAYKFLEKNLEKMFEFFCKKIFRKNIFDFFWKKKFGKKFLSFIGKKISEKNFWVFLEKKFSEKNFWLFLEKKFGKKFLSFFEKKKFRKKILSLKHELRILLVSSGGIGTRKQCYPKSHFRAYHAQRLMCIGTNDIKFVKKHGSVYGVMAIGLSV